MNVKHFEELRYCVNLPSPAGVGLAVLRSTTLSTAAPDELVSILRFDPALTVRLLRFANSASSARFHAASTIEEASSRLQPALLQDAALGFSLLPPRQLETAVQLDHDTYWSFSAACALAAQRIAELDGCVDPGAAFTAGLLSRVGVLALATIHAEAYDAILAGPAGEDRERMLAEESRQFDIDHWEAGAAVLAECRLDEGFVAAVVAQGDARAVAESWSGQTDAHARVLAEAGLVARSLLAQEAARSARKRRTLDLLAGAAAETPDPARIERVCELARADWMHACLRMRAGEGTSETAVHSPRGAAVAHEPAAALVPGRLPADQRLSPVVATIPPNEMSILVVDDDPGIRLALGSQLRKAGYRVRVARDGREALDAAVKEPPQILVTDWMMPRMSGLELIDELRRSQVGSHTYVVVLTGRSSDDQVVEAFDAGADEFVSKPFNPRILKARVQAGHRMIELQRQVEADRQSQALQVAEMGLLTRKLEVAAYTDVLTELPNRRYAIERLEADWANATRLDRPLSVLAVDVDHFKQVNDRYGHDIGDAVLRSTAGVLRTHTRRADQVCRMGGEEFLLIHVESGLEGALVCAERLRSAVALNVTGVSGANEPGSECRVTVSIGVASRAPSIKSVHELLKAADEAVYQAKAAGRNCVRASRELSGGAR